MRSPLIQIREGGTFRDIQIVATARVVQYYKFALFKTRKCRRTEKKKRRTKEKKGEQKENKGRTN